MEAIDVIEAEYKPIVKSETWDKKYKIARKDIKESFWGDFVFGGLLVSGIFIIVDSLELPRVYNLTIGIIILTIALIMIFGRLFWPKYAQKLIMKYMKLAKNYSKNNELPKALAYINKVLKFDSAYKHGWNNKGNLLSELFRFDESLLCYEKALKIDSEYKEAWNNKGSVFYTLGNYGYALECFEHVLRIDSKDKNAWNHKGIMLGIMKNYEAASKCFYQALEIDAEFGHSYYNLACTESLKGVKDEAIKFLKKAIVLDKKFRSLANIDEDFNNLREYEEFINLVKHK